MGVVITGGSGLIGSALSKRLGEVVLLSRNPQRLSGLVEGVCAKLWHPAAGQKDPRVFDGADVVINLAGASVGEGRWTQKRKKAIWESRIDGTRELVSALAARDQRPQVLVSASAVGFYGDRGDSLLDEQSAVGQGFLAEVCKAWEAEANKASALGIRVVTVRLGVVVALGGGALAKLVPLFRAGLGGRSGNGKQWMPWIHLDDVVSALLFLANTADAHGAYNVVAPSPCTNREFTQALAKTLGRPAFAHAPAPVLRLALGEMSEIILGSQRAVPKRLLDHGFSFAYDDLFEALNAVVREGQNV